MIKSRLIAFTLPLLLLACGDKDEEASLPTGQVVAKVAGEDVTVGELNAELAGANVPSSVPREDVERAAVRGIVERKLLAHEARERGLDKSPSYLLQQRRAEELLLVKLLRDQIASTVAKPTRTDAEKFIAANPTMFADRKLLSLDQIQFARPDDASLFEALKPAKTLDEVERILNDRGVEYRRMPAAFDTVGADPGLVEHILKLPEGEIFVVPQNNMILANRITSIKAQPLGGEQAINFATSMVRTQRLNEKLQSELKKIEEKGKTLITYQDRYKPKPPAAPAKAGAAKAPAAPKAEPAPAAAN